MIVDATQRMRRITFERVTIRNATLSAVEIFGADGITVEECDFSASGGAVAPGAGQHHCLKVTKASDIVIKGSRLVDSFRGCGISLAACQRVTLLDCEVARKAMDGMKVSECNDVGISDCLVEGNGGHGIETALSLVPNERLTTRNNLLQNNAGDVPSPSSSYEELKRSSGL